MQHDKENNKRRVRNFNKMKIVAKSRVPLPNSSRRLLSLSTIGLSSISISGM